MKENTKEFRAGYTAALKWARDQSPDIKYNHSVQSMVMEIERKLKELEKLAAG